LTYIERNVGVNVYRTNREINNMVMIEMLGAVTAMVLTAHTVIPVNILNRLNNEFSHRVDHGKSCFDRVGGIAGTYGSPQDYSLDLLCNYRLRSKMIDGEHRVYTLTRDGVKHEAAI